MDLGFLSIIPLIVMVVMVVTTKRIFESMIIPIILTFVLKDGTGFVFGFIDSFYDVMAEGTYPWILLMLVLFGALIELLLDSGSINAFKKLALKHVKSKKSSLVFTWVLGIILSIDNYISGLTVGPSVRTITDKYNVPRVAVGFIILCLGLSIYSLLPVTTMAVFVFGVMKDVGVSAAGSNLLTEYLKVIQYEAFPVIIVLIALLFAIGIMPKFGPMKKYFSNTGEIVEQIEAAEEAADDEKAGNLLDFILPVASIIICLIIFNEVLVGVLAALAICFIMYIPRKKVTVKQYFEDFFEGIHSMVEILAILCLVFILVNGLNELGLSEYVVSIAQPILVGPIIPVLTFILVALLVFGGVDYWAIMVLMAPIAIPLAEAFGVNLYLTMAAIVSGGVCGGVSCFFGEQMLLASKAVERKATDLAVVSLPYTLIGFALTAIVYLVLGFVV